MITSRLLRVGQRPVQKHDEQNRASREGERGGRGVTLQHLVLVQARRRKHHGYKQYVLHHFVTCNLLQPHVALTPVPRAH